MSDQSGRQSVLIVDDTPENIMILGNSLMSSYRVFVASSGELALKRVFSETPPDLILLDIVMPGMDGYEVCKRLKSDERSKDIPIIFITAKRTEEDETRGLDMGAVDYIAKPFSLPIVKARVRTHLELKRKTALLEELSFLDGLTGIPNRRRFDAVLNTEWARAVRASTALSLIMIDIDHFKAFNDACGHSAGDECLRRVGRELCACLQRPSDFVARYGGEEFAVILPQTELRGSITVAERMRGRVEALDIEHSGSPIGQATISLGTASTIPASGSSPAALVEAADRALYGAKAAGRNQVKYIP